MANRRRVWVSPDGKGGWNVKIQSTNRPIANFDNKADAINKAKSIAKNAPLGQVIIQKKDGTIQTEYTYRKDPYPPKG